MVDVDNESFSEVTLEEDAWKDSFDKLLDPRPTLRELNVIKKNVRASFNIDSSVENCSYNDSDVLVVSPKTAPMSMLNVPLLAVQTTEVVSTPVVKRYNGLNPFKCSLSPIGQWKFYYFNQNQPKNLLENISELFQATCEDLEQNTSKHNDDVPVTAGEKQSLQISNPKRSSFNKRKTTAARVLRSCENKIDEEHTKLTKVKKSENKRSKCVAFQSNPSVIIIDHDKSNKTAMTRKTRSTKINDENEQKVDQLAKPQDNSIILHSGKWRKSFNRWRRTCAVDRNRTSVVSNLCVPDESIEFIGITKGVGQRKSIYIKTEPYLDVLLKTHKQRVLEICKQKTPRPFNEIYSKDKMPKCRKVGEGAYGEVFIYASNSRKTADVVVKIIPIEGEEPINGEKPKSYEEILPEIIISMELSKLSESYLKSNATNGFVELKRAACIKGKYPKHLINAWESYKDERESENEHPGVFTDTQLYMVLELGHGGQDMESFVFENAKQAFYALHQVVATLAVAEEAYQFEHRDLHWGNILIKASKEKKIAYKLKNKELVIPTVGIAVTIIDYTLSRMTYEDCCLYNDLSSDEELFTATGDYQFDIYRMMREVLKDNWQVYEPKTNIFWISYVAQKMLDGVKYKSIQTKIHQTFLAKLKAFYKVVLNYNSATECIQYFDIAE